MKEKASLGIFGALCLATLLAACNTYPAPPAAKLAPASQAPIDETASAASIQEPQQPQKTYATDFRRTTLIVRDVESALALYRDVLGMEVSYDLETEMTGKAVPAGGVGDRARFVLLKTNDPWTGLLGLLQWTDPPLPDPGPYSTEIGPGDEVLIMRSDRIDERCAAASKVPGVTMHSQAHLHVYASRNGSGEIPLRFCTFFDPDGNVIELSELVEPAG